MKDKIFFTIIVSVFLVGTAIFGIYIWQGITETKLTATERRILDDMEKIILVGDYDFPPLSYIDFEGQYSGYEADLVAALEIWLGIPIDYYQMIWSDALDALSDGEVTGITGMRVTTERTLTYNFSKPYYQTSYSMVYIIGSDHEMVLDSDQLSVLIQRRSAAYDYYLDNFYRDGTEFIWVDNPAEAVTILSEDKADLWFENYQVARYEAHKARIADFFTYQIVPESVGDYAIALGPEYDFLVPIINKALLSLEYEGTLSELDHKWFGLTNNRPSQQRWDIILPAVLYSFFAIFIMFVLWNRVLHLKINDKTKELSKSEEKFKASFEASHDSIFIATEAGKMLDCNDNTLELFGYPNKEDFILASPEDLYPENQPDGSNSYQKFQEVLSLVIAGSNNLMFEWLYRRKDGSNFPAEVALAVYQLDGQNVIQHNVSDITERKRIQEQLEFLSLRDQLTGLYNRTFFEAELLRLEKSYNYPITLISSDLDGLKLINDTLGHQTGDQLLVECAKILQESLRSTDILARVGGDEFCAIMPNTNREIGENIIRRIRTNISIYNAKHQDLPLNLSLGLATADDPDILLKDLFKQADDLMYRDKLYRSTSVRNKVVESLLAALAERDYITEGHAQRLEELCGKMGEKIELSSRQIADLSLLAKVHDLGKVGIPDHILYKPGPLNEEEWAVMKQHTEKGFRIATSSSDLSAIAELILKHHEHWDGGGYPLGLAGDDIPVECRILAIVDAFDAMTHDRPYAAAKSRQEALDEIKGAAGSQFDPHLVDVFLSIIKGG